MADRTIKVNIVANAERLVAGLRTASSQVKSFGSQMEASALKNSAQWETAGRSMLGFGAVMTAGFGLAVKAASDWESAWTGVTKTVEGTPAQLDKVETGLRDLAKTLPASHAEIAGVAEAAGQLGISTDSVVAFTKTMIDLGETTNLSAEEAATSLARFANIMGTSQSEIDNVGSAIVGLGNNFETTESEITQMSLRIAGAGRQAGMSEGDVLGLAAALSSVGIEAEAGGSAISQTMTKIGMAVDTNGDKLEGFAEVAGMSAGQFKDAWRDDAGGAMTAFIAGLGKTEQLGKSTNQVLSELGITGIREADALRRLSAAQGLVNDAMSMGNDEYRRNNALAVEAAKRYSTTASQVQIAGNAIRDSMIDVGADFLPVVAQGAEGVAKLSNAFGDLPGPVKTAAGGIAGVTGGLALAAGAFATIVPKIAETKLAFKTLGIKARTAGIVTGLAGGAITAAAIGLTIWAQNAAEAEARTEEYMATLSETGQQTQETADAISGALSGSTDSWVDGMTTYIDLAEKMGIATSDLIGSILGQGDAQSTVNSAMDDYMADASLWEKLTTARSSQVGELRRGLEGESSALSEAERRTLQKAQADAAASESQGDLEGATDETTASVEEQVGALADQIEHLQESASLAAGLAGSQIGYQQSLADANKALKENGANLDITTQKGRDNKSALLDLADSALQVSAGMQEAGESGGKIVRQMETARADFITTATAMGLSKDAAKALANELGLLPEDVKVAVKADTRAAKNAVKQTADELKGTELGPVKITADGKVARTEGERTAADIENDAPSAWQLKALGSPALDTGKSTSDSIGSMKPDPFGLTSDPSDALGTGKATNNTLGSMKPDPFGLTANGSSALSTGRATSNDISGMDATIDVKANTSSARSSVGAWLSSIPRTITTNVQRIITERTRKGKAGGGAIYGPGTGTSDSIDARLSNGEHVLTSRDVQLMGGQGSVYAFRSALHAGEVEGFAGGGAVGSAERALRAARRQRASARTRLRRANASVKSAEKAERQAEKTKRESDDRAAQKRLNNAERSQRQAEKRYEQRDRKAQNASARLQRLREESRDTRTEVRRGSIRESARSGLSGAYGVVDQMRDLARSGDLTRRQSRRLSNSAGYSEKRMRKLYDRADDLEKKLESARGKFEDLLSIRDSVKSGLVGGFGLGEVTNPWTGTSAGTTGKDYLVSAQAYAAKMKTFAAKLKALQKKGYPGAVLQEVAAMGPEAGIPAADALLSLNAKDTKAFTSAYSSIGSYATQAGNTVTEGFYKGGVLAAKGLVGGLKSQQKNVNSAIAKMAKSMEKALKKALGIKSPSTVFRDIGQQTGAGMEAGLRDSIPAVDHAASELVSIPGHVAPSVYANAPSKSGGNVVAVVDKGAMAEAMNGVKMTLLVDGKPIEAIAQTTVDRNLAAVGTSLRGGRR